MPNDHAAPPLTKEPARVEIKPLKSTLPTKPPEGVIAYELEPGKVLFVHPLPSRLDSSALSTAEREVAALILCGRDNASIASLRRTSPRTVANQVARIFSKLGVHSRAELAVKALGGGDGGR